MAMKINGAKKVKQNLTGKINAISTNITQQSMMEGLILGGGYAALLTPVDTANLINSQYYEFPVKTATGWTASIKYTANYAQAVHDGGPKNWQKAGAEDEFLRKGFEENSKEIYQTIISGYKR